MWQKCLADDSIAKEVVNGITYMLVKAPTEIISEESLSKRRKLFYHHGEVDVPTFKDEWQKMHVPAEASERERLVGGVANGQPLLPGQAVSLAVASAGSGGGGGGFGIGSMLGFGKAGCYDTTSPMKYTPSSHSGGCPASSAASEALAGAWGLYQ